MWIGQITKDEENSLVSRRLEITVVSEAPAELYELHEDEFSEQRASVGAVAASWTAEPVYSTAAPPWFWLKMMTGYEPLVLINLPADDGSSDYDPTGTTIYVDVSFAFPNPWPGSWQDTSEFMLEMGWVPQG